MVGEEAGVASHIQEDISSLLSEEQVPEEPKKAESSTRTSNQSPEFVGFFRLFIIKF